MPNEEIDKLIIKLRHDVLIGGGYADVSRDDLELLFSEIDNLRTAVEVASYSDE